MGGNVVRFHGRRSGSIKEVDRAAVAEVADAPLEGRRIAVIGAGLSGVLVTLHLLWRCRPADRIYLVERADRLGQGVAYGTENPRHLLNIRIDNMSAFGDEPDHFMRWLANLPDTERRQAGQPSPAGLFVRRRVYGTYIQHLLEDAITRLGGGRNLYLVTDEATAVRPHPGGVVLATAGGRPYEVDSVVLALGNFPPDRDLIPGYFGNPWAPRAIKNPEPDRPILVIGTSLTMIDVCLALFDEGFAGPIIALSRRALLPQVHALAPRWDGLRLEAEDRRSLSRLCGAVRREVRRAESEGFSWHSVVDALRPHLQLLWQELSPADKARFLRHLRPWWEIHRHRVAPPVAATIDGARAQGRLRVVAGRLQAIEPSEDGLIARWSQRGSGEPRQLRVQRVINCSGPESDVARLTDPLIVQLLASRLGRPDPHRLGLHATNQGALIGADGRVTPRLFGVGPIVRGALWETTSVPDIRDQAEQVAIGALSAAGRRQIIDRHL